MLSALSRGFWWVNSLCGRLNPTWRRGFSFFLQQLIEMSRIFRSHVDQRSVQNFRVNEPLRSTWLTLVQLFFVTIQSDFLDSHSASENVNIAHYESKKDTFELKWESVSVDGSLCSLDLLAWLRLRKKDNACCFPRLITPRMVNSIRLSLIIIWLNHNNRSIAKLDKRSSLIRSSQVAVEYEKRDFVFAVTTWSVFDSGRQMTIQYLCYPT